MSDETMLWCDRASTQYALRAITSEKVVLMSRHADPVGFDHNGYEVLWHDVGVLENIHEARSLIRRLRMNS